MTDRPGFSKNRYGLKLLIFIGVLVWVFYSLFQEPGVETDLFIPIESADSRYFIQVLNPSSGGLDVRLRGPKSLVTELNASAYRYQMPLVQGDAGVKTVDVLSERLIFPSGISILQIKPEKITFRYEEQIEKLLVVEMVITGSPAKGLTVSRIKTIPERILIRGPASVVSEMKKIVTQVFDINGLDEDVKERVILDLPDHVMPIKDGIVVADIQFEQPMGIKTIREIKIKGINNDRSFSISPSTISLTIKGPEATINNVSFDENFDVFVDLEGLESGVFVRRATITLPLNFSLIKATPEVFTVHIGPEITTGG